MAKKIKQDLNEMEAPYHFNNPSISNREDDILNFREGDFGLSTSVRVLRREPPSRVQFDLTLAHIRNVNDSDAG